MPTEDNDPVATVMAAVAELRATNEANLARRDAVHDAKIAKINDTLDRFENANQKLVKVELTANAAKDAIDRLETLMNRPGTGGARPADEEARAYRAAWEHCLRRTPEERDPKMVELVNKRKAILTAGNDATAGYLLAPAEIQREIIKNVVEMSPMRGLATVRTIGGPSLKQPKRTGTFAARRVGETETRSETTGLAYGEVEIMAPEMYAEVYISQQMLEDADYDLESELNMEFSEQFGVKEGAEFISGTGASNQAEGILTNPDVGEVVSGNATAITADGLIGLYYGLKTAYSRNGLFVMNRTTIRDIRKLKDGDGQYLWSPGIVGNVPNTVLGATYVEMPDMPSIGAGTYPVAFGDFKRGYTIADRVLISVLRDPYTRSGSGQVLFRARKRVGGGVRQAEAFNKLKIST